MNQQAPYESTGNRGLVVRTGPGVYLVRSGGLIWDCKLRGRLKAKRKRLSDVTVCVGDYVVLDKMQPADAVSSGEEVAGTALISEILPRRTSLSRLAPLPWPGAVPIPQVLAVNIDLVVIVVSAVAPPLKITTIDRFLLLARQAGIEPAVCINKVDQAGIDLAATDARDMSNAGEPRTLADEGLTKDREAVFAVKAALEARGVTALLASASACQGITELKALLKGKTSVFVGHSGVGKTSLLNSICPGLYGKTLSISAVGKGRHSTTFSSLIDIGGGYVADLPGIRSIGFWNLEEKTVKREFEDIDEMAANCRFSDCSHTHEPGCAVKRALETGELDQARYEEYLKVMREASATRKRRKRAP